jgi:hypothetical protein
MADGYLDKLAAFGIAQCAVPGLDKCDCHRGEYWSEELLAKYRNKHNKIYKWAQQPSWVFDRFGATVHVYNDGTVSTSSLG